MKAQNPGSSFPKPRVASSMPAHEAQDVTDQLGSQERTTARPVSGAPISEPVFGLRAKGAAFNAPQFPMNFRASCQGRSAGHPPCSEVLLARAIRILRPQFVPRRKRKTQMTKKSSTATAIRRPFSRPSPSSARPPSRSDRSSSEGPPQRRPDYDLGRRTLKSLLHKPPDAFGSRL